MHSSNLRWAKLGVAMLACACLGAARAEAPFSLLESSVNADKSDWFGLDEDQVFFRMLRHQGDGHDWTIKIGKGGQIYSIKTPDLGELIAPQRAEHGQWVDEVFQHTLPMPPQKDKAKTSSVVDGDIHQAGYYTKSDLDRRVQILPRSVYSPLFWYRSDPQGRSVSYVTWPQHAHLPRRYGENLVLIGQTVTDKGGGVIEISVVIDKWGGATNDLVTLPWSAFRTRTLPVQVIANRDGTPRVENLRLLEKKGKKGDRIRDQTTGGWAALLSAPPPSGGGIGIVFGKDARAGDGKKGQVKRGTYGNPRKPEIGGTVVAVYREVGLEEGQSLRYRYYLVLGSLARIQERATALESQVMLEKISPSRSDSRLLEICADPRRGLRHQCGPDLVVRFRAYRDFFRGARPLFLLERTATGELLVTDDPYEISFDPTDGAAFYVDFLGWAVPQGQIPGSCGFQTLAEAVATADPPVIVGRHAADLRVPSGNAADCGG